MPPELESLCMNAPTAWSELCKTLAAPIIEACSVTPVSAGPSALTREIARHLPDRIFREVLCRGGWYRLGSLIDSNGQRIAPSLEDWAEAELEKCDGDLSALIDAYADSGLIATRLAGRTHYFVANTGPGVTDFLQLEIEDLQEQRGTRLFEGEGIPVSLDELLDRRDAPASDGGGEALGLPAYHFRRIIHVGDTLNRMRTQSLEPQPIHRFVDAWEASSAGTASAFANHWIVAVREHLDRYRQPVFRAHPVPAINGTPERFTARQGTQGLALRDALHAFDRAQGVPFAWFFHMLTTKAVPHWVATTVAEDAAAGWAYVAERDLAIVKAWLHRPYGF